MDKNTILGLLLMGVVIFGFSMLNSGDDQSNQPTTEKTEKADAKQATTDIADSLNANELARIKTIVRQYGKQDGDKMVLTNDNVSFTVASDSLTGSVMMDGNMTVALSDLQHAPSADNRLLYNAAMKKVRDAAENVAKYSDFVQFVGGGNKTVKLENELLTLDLSSKGGQIAKRYAEEIQRFPTWKRWQLRAFRQQAQLLRLRHQHRHTPFRHQGVQLHSGAGKRLYGADETRLRKGRLLRHQIYAS